MSGDVVFQTSSSNQSYAVMWASKSLYSHVGIVEVSGKRKFVIEAISRVSRTPLEKWIQRGRLGRYAVYRDESLNSDQRDAVVRGAKSMLGLHYDIYFYPNNAEIYCSELVAIAYGQGGVALGQFEKVKDLDVDNVVVRRLVQKRWRRHPACRSKVQAFDECWTKILEGQLITPASLANDPQLKRVWTNYP